MKKAIWLVATVVLAGCGPDLQGDLGAGSEELGTATEDLATTVTVKMVGHQFVPASVTVKKGTSVKFLNASTMGHTVTSGAGSNSAGAGSLFDKTVLPGKSVKVKFSTVGTRPYFCRPHEAMGMAGVVIVTP